MVERTFSSALIGLSYGFLSKSPANWVSFRCSQVSFLISQVIADGGRKEGNVATPGTNKNPDLYSTLKAVLRQMRKPLPFHPDLSNICCLIFHGTSYHIRFSRTRYSVTRRGVEDSFGEIRSPRLEYISRVCMKTAGLTSKGGREEQ